MTIRKVYILFFTLLTLIACEEIYSPKIEAIENVMVAEARIVHGGAKNFIHLYKSRGFNDTENGFSSISGASVFLINTENEEVQLPEVEDGYFPLNFELNPELKYKLKIEYGGDTFESSFEPVPKVPDMDSVYGVPETKVILESGENNVNDARQVAGVQMYSDILNEKENPFYRFTARKVLQYNYVIQELFMGQLNDIYIYGWKSYFPQESFNIAAGPEFSSSTDIFKHPLFFIEQERTINSEHIFSGWIVMIYQYGLSESAYNYYKDLNNQLNADGKLFDPVYVQARGNIKCTNNTKQIILGNFEIATIKEHRFFIKYISDELGYTFKPIPYFYEIPNFGEVRENQPEWWEYNSKVYPNE